MICNRCGSENTKESEQICRNGAKHIRVECVDCGRFIKFAKQAKTIENNKFLMPFGKHKGKSISEIATIDKDYAIWAANNCNSKNIQGRFRECLGVE